MLLVFSLALFSLSPFRVKNVLRHRSTLNRGRCQCRRHDTRAHAARYSRRHRRGLFTFPFRRRRRRARPTNQRLLRRAPANDSSRHRFLPLRAPCRVPLRSVLPKRVLSRSASVGHSAARPHSNQYARNRPPFEIGSETFSLRPASTINHFYRSAVQRHRRRSFRFLFRPALTRVVGTHLDFREYFFIFFSPIVSVQFAPTILLYFLFFY